LMSDNRFCCFVAKIYSITEFSTWEHITDIFKIVQPSSSLFLVCFGLPNWTIYLIWLFYY